MSKNEVTFRIPGRAGGKARPVVVRNKSTNKSHAFTPDPGNYFTKSVSIASDIAVKVGWVMDDDPVSIDVTVHRKMPSSFSRKKKTALEGMPVGCTPDVINTGAALCDAFEGIFYHNDKQVSSFNIERYYADYDGTVVTIKRP